MARMKTLHIEMTDPVNMFHENEKLEYARTQAWHDAIAGLYLPEDYAGDLRAAYDVGRQQIEEFCHEEGIDLFQPLEPRLEDVVDSPTVEVATIEEEILGNEDMISDKEWTGLFEGLSDV